MMTQLNLNLYYIFIFFFLINASALPLKQSDTLAPMSNSLKGKSSIITLSFLKRVNKRSLGFETSLAIVKVTLDNQIKPEEKEVEVNGEKKTFKIAEFDKYNKVFEEINTSGFFIDFAEVGKIAKRKVGDLWIRESYEATLRGWPPLKNKSVRKMTNDLMKLAELGEKNDKIIYIFLEKGLDAKTKKEIAEQLALEIAWKEKLEKGKISLPSGRTLKADLAARILAWVDQLNFNGWEEEDSIILSEQFQLMSFKDLNNTINLINQKGIGYELVKQYFAERAPEYLGKLQKIEKLALKRVGFSGCIEKLEKTLLRLIGSSS